MILTTGHDLEGYVITEYIDVIFDELLVGIGFKKADAIAAKIGIAPDYEVKLPEGDNGMYDFADLEHDIQLIKAVDVMKDILK